MEEWLDFDDKADWVRAAGGGVFLAYDSTFILNSGTITMNNSDYYGGGVALGDSNSSLIVDGISKDTVPVEGEEKMSDIKMTMNGGTISFNGSKFEGGGIFVETGCTAEIIAGNIESNNCDQGMYGGGGIYVNGGNMKGIKNGLLKITNVEIYNNQSGTEKFTDGAAIAGCPTSKVTIYQTNGAVIYGNTGSSDIYVSGVHTGNHQGRPYLYASDFMLGGGRYFWKDSHGNLFEVNENAYVHLDYGYTNSMKTDKQKNDLDVKTGVALATVHIRFNKSGQRGGGIGSNGDVEIGINENTALWLEKTVVDEDKTHTNQEYEFIVTFKFDTPFTGKINLTRYGVKEDYQWSVSFNDSMESTIRVKLKAGEGLAFVGLPKGTEYTVQEVVTGNADSTTTRYTVKELVEVTDSDHDGDEKDSAVRKYYKIEEGTDQIITGTLTENGYAGVAAYTNVFDPRRNLTITKNVSSNGEQTKDWHFNLELTIPSKYTYLEFLDKMTPTQTVTGDDNTIYRFSFTLKSGEALVVKGIPVGSTFKITEEEANKGNYVTSALVTNCGDEDGLRKYEDGISGEIVKSNQAYNGSVVNFRNEIEVLEFTVKKVWEYTNLKEGETPDLSLLPDSIKVTLTGTVPGENETPKTVYTKELTIHKNSESTAPIFIGTFTDVPKYYDGVQINYSITEEPTEGWLLKETGPIMGHVVKGGGLELVGWNLKNVQNMLSIKAVKHWTNADGTETDTNLPTEVKVQLYRRNEAQDDPVKLGEPVVLNADNNWTYEFKNLPKADKEGNAYSYSVREAEVPEGWHLSATGPVMGRVVKGGELELVGWSLTNKRAEPEKITIPVTKVWHNANGSNTTVDLPESIVVELRRNDQPTDQSITLNAGNQWKGEFKDLPVADENGNPLTYDVAEVAVTGWTSQKTGTEESGFTITNTREPRGSLTITKQVTGLTGNQDITFNFEVTGPEGYSTSFSLGRNESRTLDDLVPGEYTITEQNGRVDGYTWRARGVGTVTVEADNTTNVTITNNYEPEPTPTPTPTTTPEPTNSPEPSNTPEPSVPPTPTPSPSTPPTPTPSAPQEQTQPPEENDNPNEPQNPNEPTPEEDNLNQDIPNRDVPQGDRPDVPEDHPNNPNVPDDEPGTDLPDSDVPTSDFPPNTGETILTIIWMGLLVVSGAGILITARTKKRE